MKLIKVFIMLLIAGVLTSCSLFSDENAIKPTPLTPFKSTLPTHIAWTNKNATGASNSYLKLTPAIANGKIFTTSYIGKVRAVDTRNGRTLWQNKTKLHLSSGAAANEQLVFVGSNDGIVLALRQSNGSVAWRANVTAEILAQPAAAANIVVVKGADGKLIALDAANGKQLWDYAADEPGLTLRNSSAPQISGKYVIAGFANGHLVALNLQSGKVAWQQTVAEATGSSAIERLTDIAADPVIVDDVIYVTAYNGHLAAFSINGKLLWQQELSSYAGIAVGPTQVVAANAHGKLVAYERKSGKLLWQQNALAERNLSAPVIFGNTIAVGDVEGYIHLLTLTDGHFVARTRIDSSSIVATPLVSDNSVYVYTQKGRLARIN